MRQTREAFWWSLFSAGGVLSALFLPAIILVTGFVLPFMTGDAPEAAYEQVGGLMSFWLVRLVVFGVIMFTMFHCAHRIRHVLIDVGARPLAPMLSICCYGGAMVGTVVTAIILIK
jgi:fumarate reductase subunit D